jgi:nucleotide-binding universal stress UspA family protein
MYKRILLALDGSELAEQVLPHAVAQSSRFGAELVLLQVVEPFPRAGILWQEDVNRAEKQAMEEARDYLEAIAISIQERGLVVRPTVLQGQPDLSIVQFAETNNVDLLVICTRGHSGLSRWLMGSVANRVVRGATVPVLLATPEIVTGKKKSGENGIMYKRILLPLDGSVLAEQAVPHAVAQAERFQAEIVLLMVLQPLPQHSMSSLGRRQAEEASSNLAREYLESTAADIHKRDIPVQVITVEGQAHTQIVQFAETNGVDLIVISTRGQSGLSHWLMGSVADRVVRGAKTPALLVRAEQKKE